MVQQNVPAMLEAVFNIIDAGEASQQRVEIPPLLISSREHLA
jgi:LacI family fructose operon transcriptional repressor